MPRKATQPRSSVNTNKIVIKTTTRYTTGKDKGKLFKNEPETETPNYALSHPPPSPEQQRAMRRQLRRADITAKTLLRLDHRLKMMDEIEDNFPALRQRLIQQITDGTAPDIVVDPFCAQIWGPAPQQKKLKR